MRGPVSVASARSFAVGIVLVAVMGLITYVSMTANQGLPLVPKSDVKVAFNDVGSLREGDEVRQHSIPIGRVAGIEYVRGKALVTLQLQGDHPVYHDAKALIWDLSALAQKFVEIKPGTPPAGPLGEDVLPGTRTTGSADLYQLLNVFDPATRDALTSGVRELGTGLAGHGRDLQDAAGAAPDLLTDLGTVSSSAASEQAELPALLRNTDRLASRFVGRQDQIAKLVDQAGRTLDAVGVDEGQPLQDSIHRLPGTLEKTRIGLGDLESPLGDTHSALATLQPGAQALGDATPDLRRVLREGIQPLDKVPDVAERAEPAVEDLTPTLADARPLAPPIVHALSDAAPLLDVLAPYTGDIVEFFLRIKSFVSESSDPSTHWARLGVGVSSGTAQALGTVRDPLLPRSPYPAPGEASQQRNTIGGGQ